MKRYHHFFAAAFATFILGGCLGGQFDLGSSANPPADVKLVAGDGTVTATWTMAPNVEYWIFSAVADSISTDNWARLLGARATIAAVSPQVISGLSNDIKYSFTVNGRVDGGPGGPGSTSISVVPRLAGAEWSVGKPLANDLRGTVYGTVFVAVGAGGPDRNEDTVAVNQAEQVLGSTGIGAGPCLAIHAVDDRPIGARCDV